MFLKRFFVLTFIFGFFFNSFANDVIYTRNGTILDVIIQKMGSEFVAYKLASKTSGEMLYLSNDQILKIDFDGASPHSYDYTKGDQVPEVLRIGGGRYLIDHQIGNRRDYAQYLKLHAKDAYSHYMWGSACMYTGIALSATSIVSTGMLFYHKIKGNEEVDNALFYARSNNLPKPILDTYGSHQNAYTNSATVSAITGLFGVTFLFVGLYQRHISYNIYVRNRHSNQQEIVFTPYVGLNQVGVQINF